MYLYMYINAYIKISIHGFCFVLRTNNVIVKVNIYILLLKKNYCYIISIEIVLI